MLNSGSTHQQLLQHRWPEKHVQCKQLGLKRCRVSKTGLLEGVEHAAQYAGPYLHVLLSAGFIHHCLHEETLQCANALHTHIAMQQVTFCATIASCIILFADAPSVTLCSRPSTAKHQILTHCEQCTSRTEALHIVKMLCSKCCIWCQLITDHMHTMLTDRHDSTQVATACMQDTAARCVPSCCLVNALCIWSQFELWYKAKQLLLQAVEQHALCCLCSKRSAARSCAARLNLGNAMRDEHWHQLARAPLLSSLSKDQSAMLSG